MKSYIGNEPIAQAAGFRHEVIATAGQTDFVVGYAPGYLDVFKNGIKLGVDDFTATDGATVTLVQGAAANDLIAFIAWARGTMAPVTDFAPITRSRKNLLINGDFQIWQRGTTFTDITANQYTADRWYASISGATATIQRTQFGAGSTGVPQSGLLMAVTVGNDYAALIQRIENPSHAVGKTVTFSGLINTNRSGLKSRCNLYRVASGPADPQIKTSNIVDVPNTGGLWAYHSWQINVPERDPSWLLIDKVAVQFVLFDQYSDTSTAAWTAGIFNAQLEVGDTATDFDYRHPAEELALCQRYYVVDSGVVAVMFSGDVTSPGTYSAKAVFPTEMRIAPAITLANSAPPALFPATSGTANYTNTKGFREFRSPTGTGLGFFSSTYTADAEL